MCGLLVLTQLMRNQLWSLFPGKTHGFLHEAKRQSPKAVWRRNGERFVWSSCPSLPSLPFVLTAAVTNASLPLDQVSGGPHRCAAVSSAVINIRTNPRLSREEPIASEKQARCAQHPCSGWPRAAVSHLPEACSRLCLFLLEVKRAAKNIQINESRRPAMRAEVLSKTEKAHYFKIRPPTGIRLR